MAPPLNEIDILGEIQDSMIEPNDGGLTWQSELWTTQEVLNYLNNRQYDFLKRTHLVLKRAPINVNPGVIRHPLPTDWVATQRVVWLSSDPIPTYTEVPRSDGWEADHAILDWPFNAGDPPPQSYTDGELPTLQLEIFPAPNNAGQLQILYTFLSVFMDGTGNAFAVPDEFVAAIKYGTMADMLGKVSRVQDIQRAEYCEARYEEGIAAAQIMLRGLA